MDCWLALRGNQTLPLRMRQHDMGRRIMVARRKDVPRVYYPTPSHPQHELACRRIAASAA
jgi:cystathionine beta-lyase/cystathionine gamma-synthase